MHVIVDTDKVGVPEPELGLINLTEFRKSKEFVLKCLSSEDVKILKETYQFSVYPLEIKDRLQGTMKS